MSFSSWYLSQMDFEVSFHLFLLISIEALLEVIPTEKFARLTFMDKKLYSLSKSLQCSLHKKWSFPLTISSVYISSVKIFRRKLQIWSQLLKKSFMENFIFCAMALAFLLTDRSKLILTSFWSKLLPPPSQPPLSTLANFTGFLPLRRRQLFITNSSLHPRKQGSDNIHAQCLYSVPRCL